MAALIEAIEIKRKMFFEYEGAPYHCLDVDVSKPTARGGQTLVRIKMRNLLTRQVFDKTFKAGEKFSEPDLNAVAASYLYADTSGYHFMDQETFENVTLQRDIIGDPADFLKDGMVVDVQFHDGNAIGCDLPAHVELKVEETDPGFKGDTATGATKPATLETRAVVNVPLFVNPGDVIRIDTRDRRYIGRVGS